MANAQPRQRFRRLLVATLLLLMTIPAQTLTKTVHVDAVAQNRDQPLVSLPTREPREELQV